MALVSHADPPYRILNYQSPLIKCIMNYFEPIEKYTILLVINSLGQKKRRPVFRAVQWYPVALVVSVPSVFVPSLLRLRD